ncbi:hypothetical protein AVEN_206411-1 [Araneus ventricosus]|uniref:Uncharacterized protein n=1 Tax=Araneus ventricosus TaxID=182803 RepID=A0A4Y2T015_ARAVE|nr:hypothetical protein AVEN_206411-1 [Araneus ventricosus]
MDGCQYYAIMYPLSLRWTKSRGPLIMMIIWGSAFGLSSFQLIHGRAEKFVLGGQEFYDCTEVWDEVEGKYFLEMQNFRNAMVWWIHCILRKVYTEADLVTIACYRDRDEESIYSRCFIAT